MATLEEVNSATGGVEYRYRDIDAAKLEGELMSVSEWRQRAARMIGFQRAVIQELRSRHDAQLVRITALEEALQAARADSLA